jgi:hypothetical protein
MNGAPSYEIERVQGGYVAGLRWPHKASIVTICTNGEPRLFKNRVLALQAVLDAIVGYGWPRVTGTADGIPKRPCNRNRQEAEAMFKGNDA